MGSMAAADVLIMAVYFAALMGLVQSGTMRSWFPGRGGVGGENEGNGANAGGRDGPTAYPSPGEMTATGPSGGGQDTAIAGGVRAAAALFAASLSLLIVESSNALERAASPVAPGLGCGFVALQSALARRLLGRSGRGREGSEGGGVARRERSRRGAFALAVDSVAPVASDLCLRLFFASVGASADLYRALERGPACVAFASLALAVHATTILLGTLAARGALGRGGRGAGEGDGPGPSSSWMISPCVEEVAVASNAAIGGPATAAAFASSVAKSWTAEARRGLQTAAMVWGVVGYAAGTGIGVAMTRFAMGVLRSGTMAFETFHP